MNRLMIIGNLTRDPETGTTASGVNFCKFSVAVNLWRKDRDHPVADYFQVTAWRALGDSCAKYLSKGKKVCVVGSVKASAYTGRDGSLRASLEVDASEVEFLSARGQDGEMVAVDGAEAEAAFGGQDPEDRPY